LGLDPGLVTTSNPPSSSAARTLGLEIAATSSAFMRATSAADIFGGPRKPTQDCGIA
jgi:hypothetical protein